MVRYVLALVFLPVISHSADGFIEKSFGVAGRIQSVTIADFNGDARPDVAVRTHDALQVFVNAGGGNLLPPIKIVLPWGVASASVTDYGVGRSEVAADFNRDGHVDLAIRDRNEVLFGVGDGTFRSPEPIGGGTQSFYGLTAAGDFNADQNPDLVFFVRGSLAVLYGNGDGTFQLGGTYELGGDGQLLVADLNEDERSDLAYLQYPLLPGTVGPGWWYPLNCCALRILLSVSDGLRETARLDGIWPGSIFQGDFNGDGTSDIATSNTVLLGKGKIEFEPGHHLEDADADWYQLPSGPAAAADLNGDSVLDLVYFGTTEGRTIVGLQGVGDGTFVPANPSSFWFHLWLNEDRRVAGTADFNGDGRPDVLTAVYCPEQQRADVWRFGWLGCFATSDNLTLFLNAT